MPRATVEAGYALVEEAEVLLVLGSSLAVFSGYRFVKRAHEQHKPIAIVSLGETRADALALVCMQHKLGDALPELATKLLHRA